jgi:predicted CxxxxCH...CXXCH cytochrome family protein
MKNKKILFLTILIIFAFECSEVNEKTAVPQSSVNTGECGLCHGSKVASLPPKDAGHKYHVDTLKYKCSYCHEGYYIDNKTGVWHVNPLLHMNGNVDVVFSAPYNDSSRAYYDKNLKQCNNVYCHGAIPQGTRASVIWSSGIKINLRCYACHDSASFANYHYGHGRTAVYTGTNPRGGTVQQCFKCHGDNISDTAYFVAWKRVDSLKHINGIFDKGSCRNCHADWSSWEEYLNYRASHP